MVFSKNQTNVETIIFSNISIKIAIILGFIAIFIVNIATLFYPTQGYELSIYEATPSIIWISLIFSSLCGISIIVLEVYTKRCDYSNTWISGLIILLISRVTLLYIPYNRGYLAWQGDHMSHIGMVFDILTSGFVETTNFYPITHIFLSEIVIISNLTTEFVIKYSTALMSVFFVISIYFIGKFLINDKRVTLLSLAATGCAMLVYDVNLMPNGWSVLFFPFALVLILKAVQREGKLAFGILATIVLILYPFFHTLSALILAILLLIITLVYKCLDKFRSLHDRIENQFVLPDNAPSYAILYILFVSWITWTLSFKTFYPNIRLLYKSIFLGISKDPLADMGDKFLKMDFDVFDIIFLVLKTQGVQIIFLILFILGSYLAYKKYRKEQEFKRIILFISITLFLGFIYTSYLFNILPGLGSIHGGRILAYAVVFTPFFTGFVYLHILSKKKAVCVLLCIGIMIIPVILSTFGLFISPYVHRPTPQATTMDMYGMEWSIIKKDINIEYTPILSAPYRFADSILGFRDSKQRSDISKSSKHVPDHFNYSEIFYLGEDYPSDRYLVLTCLDKIVYETVYKPVGRFNAADFIRMKSDPSIQYLYNNGECEVYYINSVL